MATRWGIISAGLISSDFVSAMQVLPKEEHQVVAVAARSLQDAKNFAAKFDIEKAYGSYSEVANDPNVDVVYIGTIQTYHLPVATEMLKAGKAVLCEKPLCMNVRETRQLIQTAQECGVFFMEAVWSRFFPVYRELSRRLKDGEIGEVVQVIASFGKNLPHVERLQRPETGGGATLDIGIYPVQLTSLAMGGDKPLKVLAGGHLNKNVHYPMWCPEVMEGPWGKSTHPLPKNSFTFHFNNSEGLMYEAAEVRRCLNEGLLESPGMPHAESITLAEVMEEIRTQVGTVYLQDSM